MRGGCGAARREGGRLQFGAALPPCAHGAHALLEIRVCMQCRVRRQARAQHLRGHSLGPAGNRATQHSTTVVLHRDARVRSGEVRSHAGVHAR